MTLTSVKEKMALAAGKAAKAMATATFIGIVGCSLVGGYAYSKARGEAELIQQNVRWGNDNGTWVQLAASDEYDCTGSTGTCTRIYPPGQNPNTNPSGFLEEEDGDFQQ